MGAFSSKNVDITELNKQKIEKTRIIIDQIATGYILQSDFADMMNLTNNDYCNKTIILTKDIINKHMTTIQIDNLYDTIVDKKEMQTMYVGLLDKIQTDKTTKCEKIAEFYILANHIFNLIKKIFLVNPENNKEDLDNICNNRLNRIKITNKNDNIITLNNDCNLNMPNTELLEKLYENVNQQEISALEQAELQKLKLQVKQSEEKIKKCNEEKGNQIDNNLIINNTDLNYQAYLNNLETIEQSILTGQLSLIKILDELFLPINQNDTTMTKMKYTIHPKLNMKKMVDLAIETRKIITSMYSSCEQKYIDNITIQERIRQQQQSALL